MKCPRCSRDTYSKKWNSCTADGCALNHSVSRETIVAVVPRVTKSKSVTKVGRPKRYTSRAEQQAAYRARKKESA